MLIREQRIEDIPEFVLLVNEVWNETYRGIIDDEFLDNLKNTVDVRIENQTKQFYKKTSYSYVLEDNGKLIGYTSIDKSKDQDYPDSGEIVTIYLLKIYQGKGYGKMIFEHSLSKLKELGYNDYIISCLADNPTNEFYKKMGGKLYKQKPSKMGNKEYLENYYIFNIN